jgi:fucose permease
VQQVACAAIEVGTCVWTFWDSDAASFKAETEALNSSDDGGVRRALFDRRFARVTWLLAFFLLIYVGQEVAIGGWVVTFLMRVRDGGDFASGMGATGYWLGITFGRVVLGFITPRIGEKTAIVVSLFCSNILISLPLLLHYNLTTLPYPTLPPSQIYNILAIVFALIFWLVPNFYASVIAVSIQGFFLGPMFPGAVVVATRLLPRSMHVSAIGFAAAFGASGAAVLPFAVGAIAQAKGVEVLQPFIVGLGAGMTLLWCALPRMPKRGVVQEDGNEEGQQERSREGEQV